MLKHKFVIILAIMLLFTGNATNIPVAGRASSGFVVDRYALQQSKTCLFNLLWYEAAGEPAAGIAAVAEVVMNRVMHPKYPDTVCKVALQPKQFSAFNNNASKAFKSPVKRLDTPAGRVIAKLVDKHVVGASSWLPAGAIKQSIVVDSKLVLYYHTKHVNPVWNRKLKLVKQVGNHKFWAYKD